MFDKGTALQEGHVLEHLIKGIVASYIREFTLSLKFMYEVSPV